MSLSQSVALPPATAVLAERPTIALDDVDAAHTTIAELFCEHRLSPLERTQVRMRLRSSHDDGVGLEMLDYGEAVRISPVGLGDFHLVQIPLTGRAALRAGHAEVDSSPHAATVPPLDQDFTMTWDRGTPHLIVYVRRSLLVRTAALVYGVTDPERLRLALRMPLDTSAGQAFLRAVFELHDTWEGKTSIDGYARRIASELLLTRMLSAVENSVTRSLDSWGSVRSPAGGDRVDRLNRRLVERIEAAAEKGEGVLDVARDLGTPLRTLQQHARAAGSPPPSTLLRDARFRRARRLLVEAVPGHTSVTAIAQSCGFGHLGRFAAEYRARYGENPTTTLHS